MNDSKPCVGRDEAMVHALRARLAAEIARYVDEAGEAQARAAERLGIHQPTLSLITRGRVDNLSLELLIRISVRAGLALKLTVGPEVEDAAVSRVEGSSSPVRQRPYSAVASAARKTLEAAEARMTPDERLAALIAHADAMAELAEAGRLARESRLKQDSP